MRARLRRTWRRRRAASGRFVAFLLLGVLIGLEGCATGGGAAPRVAERLRNRLATAGIGTTPLSDLYNAAILNSAVFRAEHQQSLDPVTGPTVMGSMVSCECGTSASLCSALCGLKAGSQKAPSDIWLSRSDQFLQFCQGFPSDLTADQVILKLQQLLGLPPQTNPGGACTWKVLQVNVVKPEVPRQFFRPCTDPDPTTSGPCAAYFSGNPPLATPDFRAWLAGQAFSSWQIPNGYPWTHLGYTYNWDPQAASIVGVSEYVIAQDSPIQVLDVVAAVPLCTQGRLRCP
jgi:hypothetical protein